MPDIKHWSIMTVFIMWNRQIVYLIDISLLYTKGGIITQQPICIFDISISKVYIFTLIIYYWTKHVGLKFKFVTAKFLQKQ